MSRNYRVGADVYLGADEARALMGRWRGGGRMFNVRRSGPGWGGGEVVVEPGPYNATSPAEHREWCRREWERRHPGVPFEGAEAVVQGWYQIMGAAQAGDPQAQSVVAQLTQGSPGLTPRAWLAPAPDPTLASRQGLPMNTGGQKVPYNSTAIITSRPQRVAFRPERIFVSPPIGGTTGLGSAGWFINDITIGNRSQLVQAGGLPGDMFQNTSIDSFVTFETAQTSMDVVISTTLIDTAFVETSGAVFYGGIIGTAAI
jgi:hypothetical protein